MSESVSKSALLVLASVKPIAAWAANSLPRYERELSEALKAKDPLRVANAQREIARIRSKVGLEGRD